MGPILEVVCNGVNWAYTPSHNGASPYKRHLRRLSVGSEASSYLVPCGSAYALAHDMHLYQVLIQPR